MVLLVGCSSSSLLLFDDDAIEYILEIQIRSDLTTRKKRVKLKLWFKKVHIHISDGDMFKLEICATMQLLLY